MKSTVVLCREIIIIKILCVFEKSRECDNTYCQRDEINDDVNLNTKICNIESCKKTCRYLSSKKYLQTKQNKRKNLVYSHISWNNQRWTVSVWDCWNSYKSDN